MYSILALRATYCARGPQYPPKCVRGRQITISSLFVFGGSYDVINEQHENLSLQLGRDAHVRYDALLPFSRISGVPMGCSCTQKRPS